MPSFFVATLIGKAVGMSNAEVFAIQPPIKRYGVVFNQVILSSSDLVKEHMLFLAVDGKVAEWTELASSHSDRGVGVLLTDIGALQIRSIKRLRQIKENGMNAFLDDYIPGVNNKHISALRENYKNFVQGVDA